MASSGRCRPCLWMRRAARRKAASPPCPPHTGASWALTVLPQARGGGPHSGRRRHPALPRWETGGSGHHHAARWGFHREQCQQTWGRAAFAHISLQARVPSETQPGSRRGGRVEKKPSEGSRPDPRPVPEPSAYHPGSGGGGAPGRGRGRGAPTAALFSAHFCVTGLQQGKLSPAVGKHPFPLLPPPAKCLHQLGSQASHKLPAGAGASRPPLSGWEAVPKRPRLTRRTLQAPGPQEESDPGGWSIGEH